MTNQEQFGLEDLGAVERKAWLDIALRYGDDRLILGQLLSMWSGVAPMLEEDIALSNIALDCIGQANLWLDLAGKLEGEQRDADKLAFFRSTREFRCCLLAQQENGDFAQTMMRHFFYDAFAVPFLEQLSKSQFKDIADIALTSLKEAKYHLRHSSQWICRLGAGTEESASRSKSALSHLAPYCAELFEEDDVYSSLSSALPNLKQVKESFDLTLGQVFEEAELSFPAELVAQTGGRSGMHGEYLGHVLAEMQSLPRAHPDAKW